MKLSKKDKEYLKKCGYREKDMEQIEKAMTKTIYKINNRERITKEKASEMLGREAYLSGLSRSAFHRSSAMEISNSGNIVSFDSSRIFQ